MLVCGFALLNMASCTSGCSKKTRRTADDTLVVLVETKIRDVDPRFAVTSHDMKLSRLVAPGLFSIDNPSLEPLPLLAQSAKQRHPLVWEVTIRPEQRFATGDIVTAKDVVFTYDSVLNPETKSLYRKGFAERFDRVVAESEEIVVFYLKKPLATFLSDLDFGIVSRRHATEPRMRFAQGKPIGAGPYQVAEVSQTKVLLVRNRHFAGDRPPLRRIEVRVVDDSNARTLMMIGGSADFAQNAVRPDLVNDVAKRDRIQILSGPSAILTYLMMNNEDAILASREVRKAIAFAIDRQSIIDARFSGHAQLATGLLPPVHWMYHSKVQQYPYLPQKAKALLDKAGYPDPDGDGPQHRFSLVYKTSSDPFRWAVARTIGQQLSKVGIHVEVRAYEFGTFFRDIKQGNFQLGSMQTAPITDPDYYYSYFHSSRIPNKENPHTGNRWRFRNEVIDRLIEQGRLVADPNKRREIYDRVQELWAEDIPVVPLWHENNVAIMNTDVQGFYLLPSARFAGLASVLKQAE